MHAIQVQTFGGPDVMRLEEAPTPEPGAGEVRVRIEAAGVNFIDIYQRSGQYQVPLPFVPGQEAAGVVEAVGAEVSELRTGDRVGYAGPRGAYAELAVVPAQRCIPLPPAIDSRQAAAVLLQGMTAHYLSHDTYPIQRGDNVLIHAAAGGVGLLLVQLAKRRGAYVIGTVSTEEKAQVARAAGADEIILYTQADVVEETRRLTGGQGVAAAYDSVGKDTFEASLACLRPRGYLVLFGQSSGPVAPVDPQVLNAKGSLFLTRPTLAHYASDRRELLQRAGALFTAIEDGSLRLRIERSLPLAQAAEAHRLLGQRKTSGKLLLIPGV